jgi:hypothetical protein
MYNAEIKLVKEIYAVVRVSRTIQWAHRLWFVRHEPRLLGAPAPANAAGGVLANSLTADSKK